MYDAQADTIDVDDIAKNSNNRIVMRRIKMNDVTFDANDDNNESFSLWIQNHHDVNGEGCVDYVPEGAYDMGWLGYFVGKNNHLKRLYINSFTPTSGSSLRDVLDPFFRGVSSNKSIKKIDLAGMDMLGGEVFTVLGPFFKNISSLTDIDINNCVWGDEGGRLFALAIGSSTNKSLERVTLRNNNISDEGMVDIITALSVHPHLKRLNLVGNGLRENGCVALVTLLRCSAKELQYLYISNNDVGDEGIEALVPALANCNQLNELYISDNPSITTKGWQSLATILEAPNSNLEVLDMSQNNVNDEPVASFASALANNHTLHTLYLDNNRSITAFGLQAFSNVLCDTTSINSTYLSNHTLYYLGDEFYENAIIGPLLDMNERDDKKEVAVIKILQNHSDFDMQPFFEWEFKVLPLVLSWLERASVFEMPEDFEPNIEPRKLSTIYQFVRGMPVLYVETRLRKELEDIKAEESQMEEKFKEEQRRLLQEIKHRKQEFEQRKQYLQERKESIMKNLGAGGNLQT